MSQNLVINGVTYQYPETNDTDWGDQATQWAVAVTQGMLQKAGGTFTLTSELDFGTSFGIKSLYYKSRGTNPADAGILRLSNAENVAWRNAANSGNNTLTTDGTDRLVYNGLALDRQTSALLSPSGTVTLTVSSNQNQTLNPSVDIDLLMPTTNITSGDPYFITNRSATKVITVKASGGSVITKLIPKSWVRFECVTTTPTANTDWIQTAAGGDWVDAGLVAGDFTGFGTPTTMNSYCRRNGPNYEGRVYMVGGIPTTTEARVNLGFGITTSANILTIEAFGEVAPVANYSGAGDRRSFVLGEASKAYMTFSFSDAIGNNLQKANGDDFGTALEMYFSFSVPASGFEIN